jgi:tetratricopeptide (TPR) repeat protein
MPLSKRTPYEVALTYSALGDVYQEEVRFEEAEQFYRKGIAILLHEPGRAHALALMWRSLASALIGETYYREALAALDEASKLVQSNSLQDAQLKAQILNGRGVVYFYQRKLGKAKTHFSRALQTKLSAGDAEGLMTEDILNNLARAYHSSGQRAKAEETYERALKIAEARLGSLHPNLVTALTNLGDLCNDLGRYDAAEGYFQRTLIILQNSGNAFDQVRVMQALYGLSKTYLLKHDPVRAEPLLSRAVEIARQNVNQAIMIPEILRILDDYSKVLRELRRSADADQLHAEAQRIRATAAFTVHVKAKW